MSDGQMTVRVAEKLKEKFHGEADVLFDCPSSSPDDPNRGLIYSWFGDEIRRESLLANLDIAIVLSTNQVLFLIEVEEAKASPKKLLGDAFATLFGEQFTFKRERNLRVGEWTTLIILYKGGARPNQDKFLTDKINHLQSSQIKTSIGAFKDEKDLENTLTIQIRHALDNRKSAI